MSEFEIGLIATLKVLLISIFALCYWWGGRKQKWVRRYLGASFFGGMIIIFSLWQGCFSYFYFLYIPALIIALSLGYGGDSFWEKFRRRFIYGLVIGLSPLPIAIVNGAWVLFGCQLGLSIIASVVMGVFNPFMSAVEEENVIAVASTLLVPFMLSYGG